MVSNENMLHSKMTTTRLVMFRVGCRHCKARPVHRLQHQISRGAHTSHRRRGGKPDPRPPICHLDEKRRRLFSISPSHFRAVGGSSTSTRTRSARQLLRKENRPRHLGILISKEFACAAHRRVKTTGALLDRDRIRTTTSTQASCFIIWPLTVKMCIRRSNKRANGGPPRGTRHWRLFPHPAE